MPGRILLLGEVGSQLEPRLTYDGLRDMLQDLRLAGQRMPGCILLSEYDRRQVNQEILGASIVPVAKADQSEEHDNRAVGFIEGVMFRAAPDVPRGKCRFLYPALPDSKPLPKGKPVRVLLG